MGALPKRKYAKARQGGRRSHLALKPSLLVQCPQCHALKPPHQVCPQCGSYAGRQAIAVKEQRRNR